MDQPRRRFMAQSLVLLAGAPTIMTMPHLALLGDSIFDNGGYTGGKPEVIAQVRDALPSDWKASLFAVDGATTRDIASQLARLPSDVTDLVLSVGGNDALGRSDILDMPAKSTAQAFTMLADAIREFETAYRKVVALCIRVGLPLTICTIYNGNFPELNFQRRASTAVAVFDDAIIRVGGENRLTVIELRQICDRPEDYANQIEPSSIGGAKIAKVIAGVVTKSRNAAYQARVVA